MLPSLHSILVSATAWDHVMGSGPVVQFVLFLLIALSVMTWAIVGFKGLHLRRAMKETDVFLDHFWDAKNFESAAEIARDLPNSPVANIFLDAFRDLKSYRKERQTVAEEASSLRELSRHSVQGLERTLQGKGVQEVARMETYLPFLGTVASAAPFIGLFGTVWGIMDAFAAISVTGSASLEVVAGPVAEALIATAAGLAAAIPAVAGYNWLLGLVRRQQTEMENFGLELLNLSERYFLR